VDTFFERANDPDSLTFAARPLERRRRSLPEGRGGPMKLLVSIPYDPENARLIASAATGEGRTPRLSHFVHGADLTRRAYQLTPRSQNRGKSRRHSRGVRTKNEKNSIEARLFSTLLQQRGL
jgi:hypothetical protein